MQEMEYTCRQGGLSQETLHSAVDALQAQFPSARRILILPPDFTRCHSYGGELTQLLYRRFAAAGAEIDVMPALGTHMPMTPEEQRMFFGTAVPASRILTHRWQSDTVCLGKIPGEVVSRISEGLYREPIDVELNHRLLDGKYDLILSVGQVVPHEVVGMANYSKNLFVGVGGRSMINQSHLLSAVCGMEKALGVRDSPTRQLYDYAQQQFVDGKLPVVFLLTVVTCHEKSTQLNGLYIGTERTAFEKACALSQELNITRVSRRAKKVVAYLDPAELKTTWVGNKGIYRTRMIVEDGGELLLLAPGVRAFGENAEMDAMTRRYGYTGRAHILELVDQGVFDGRAMSAAHLIQGSSDGRFTITYATRPELLSREEVEGVGYHWMDYEQAAERYRPETAADGWNRTGDGEEFYYVGAPALGLWKCAESGS
jgi:nickel-dependent lactate racemase